MLRKDKKLKQTPKSIFLFQRITKFSNKLNPYQPSLKLLNKKKSHKINSAFNYISETLAHFHNLYKIHELL